MDVDADADVVDVVAPVPLAEPTAPVLPIASCPELVLSPEQPATRQMAHKPTTSLLQPTPPRRFEGTSSIAPSEWGTRSTFLKSASDWRTAPIAVVEELLRVSQARRRRCDDVKPKSRPTKSDPNRALAGQDERTFLMQVMSARATALAV